MNVNGSLQRCKTVSLNGDELMEAVKKMLPYVKRYVLLAIYDVLDKEACIYELKEA